MTIPYPQKFQVRSNRENIAQLWAQFAAAALSGIASIGSDVVYEEGYTAGRWAAERADELIDEFLKRFEYKETPDDPG